MLNYTAVAPSEWKRALVKCLLHRANVVCSNQMLLMMEINKIKQIFQKNGYPNDFVNNIVAEYNKNRAVQQESTGDASTVSGTNTTEEIKPYLLFKIPFVGEASTLFSKRIKKVVKRQLDENIRIVYNTTRVQDSFVLKDHSPKSILTKVVYRFTCPRDSDTQYIGYTNRPLQARVKEHLTKGNSAISDHIASCQGCNGTRLSIDNFDILRKCRKKADTPIYEAILIKKYNPSLNRQLVKPGWQHRLKVFI